LNATDKEKALMIDYMTLEPYHNICYWHLSRSRDIIISTDVTVNMGGVFACSSEDQLQYWVEIASLPDVEINVDRWRGAEGEVMDNGWIR
jgi:hypothetical protein